MSIIRRSLNRLNYTSLSVHDLPSFYNVETSGTSTSTTIQPWRTSKLGYEINQVTTNTQLSALKRTLCTRLDNG